MSTTERTPEYDATFRSDLDRFAWLAGMGPYPGPLPKPPQADEAAPQAPAGEVQADPPGPASTDGTIPAGPVAGPGGATDSAPGAPLDETEPATPPAGEGLSAEAPGAGQGTGEDVAAQVREGIAAAERGETVDLGSFAQYAGQPDAEPQP